MSTDPQYQVRPGEYLLRPPKRFRFNEPAINFVCGVSLLSYGLLHPQGQMLDVYAGVTILVVAVLVFVFLVKKPAWHVFSPEGVLRIVNGKKERWGWQNFSEARATRDETNARVELKRVGSNEIVSIHFLVNEELDSALQVIQNNLKEPVKDLAVEPWPNQKINLPWAELRPAILVCLLLPALFILKPKFAESDIGGDLDLTDAGPSEAVSEDAISDLDDFNSTVNLEQVSESNVADREPAAIDSENNKHALSGYEKGPIPVQDPQNLSNEELARSLGLVNLPENAELVKDLRDLVAERNILTAYRGLAHKNYVAPVADPESRYAQVNAQIESKKQIAIAELKKAGKFAEGSVDAPPSMDQGLDALEGSE